MVAWNSPAGVDVAVQMRDAVLSEQHVSEDVAGYLRSLLDGHDADWPTESPSVAAPMLDEAAPAVALRVGLRRNGTHSWGYGDPCVRPDYPRTSIRTLAEQTVVALLRRSSDGST